VSIAWPVRSKKPGDSEAPRRGATDRREERHSIVDGAGAVDSGAFTSSLRGASKATTEPIKSGESV